MDYSNFEPRRTTSLKLSKQAHSWFTQFAKAFGATKQAILKQIVEELKFQTINENMDNELPLRLRVKYAVIAILRRESVKEIEAHYVRPKHYRAKTPVWLMKEGEN